MTLDNLKTGESARILSVGGDAALRRHFLDMGLTPGSVATLVKKAPMGDPLEICIRGYELTLRKEDAARIACERAAEIKKEQSGKPRKMINHPQVGELGTHKRSDKPLIPETTPIVFALAGNQNCGKTTLFNQLTGSNQHVGNFPGVTVERKTGICRMGDIRIEIIDLPVFNDTVFMNRLGNANRSSLNRPTNHHLRRRLVVSLRDLNDDGVFHRRSCLR